MAGETLDKIFEVPAPAMLVLGNIRGSVRVEPGPDGEIAIRAVKQTDSGDAKHTEILISQAEDGCVRVETKYQEMGWLFHNRPCKVDYSVQVPRQCSVKLSGVSNSTWMAGIEGDLSVSTVSGDVALVDLQGKVKANSVSGKIQAERISAPIVFKTVSGGVRLDACHLPSIEGNTVSGNVTIDTALGDGPYRLDSISGRASWRLPAESACTVKMDSLSGRLRTNLPKTIVQSERRHGPGGKQVADLNRGGVTISFHSISGDLHLESETGGTVLAESAPEAGEENRPESDETKPLSKMEVLERIERGEMTVEEGLKYL